MVNYNKALELATKLIEQNGVYAGKPTKKLAKEIRGTQTEIKKVCSDAKKDLMPSKDAVAE